MKPFLFGKLDPATKAKAAPQLVVTIPNLETVSEANSHTHWRKRQRRAKSQRSLTNLMLRSFLGWAPQLPVFITITRLSPRELDSDNLHGALKHVRDGVADWFGFDDRDSRYDWRVAQEKSKAKGVRIEIAPADGMAR